MQERAAWLETVRREECSRDSTRLLALGGKLREVPCTGFYFSVNRRPGHLLGPFESAQSTCVWAAEPRCRRLHSPYWFLLSPGPVLGAEAHKKVL